MQIGIEIGGTKLQIVTGDETGQIQQRHRFMVNKEEGANGILNHIEDVLRQLPETPASVGVGFGGPVDWRTGRIATSHQVEGWAGFDLAGWLREHTGSADIRIENDANVAALGEAVRGMGSSFSQVFYVTLGSGVGGGMVIDGKIYHGAIPGEAEIGHLWLVPPGADGNPGQTIEQTCSGWAVDQQIRELLPQLDNTSPLKKLVGNTTGGEARFLHPAYEQSDPVARMLIEQIGSVLAFGLSHVVHLLHPQAIVLGGGLSLIGEPLRAAVRTALPRFVMSAFHPAPVVLLAKLGEDAVPTGALLL